MKKPTQKQMLLNHLLTGEKISTRKATLVFGIYRLSERIRELQKMGFPITSTMIKLNGKRFAEYSLVDSQKAAEIIQKLGYKL